MATRGSYVQKKKKTLWKKKNRGHPENVSFMQFSQNIDGFRQNGSQGFQNSYNTINKTH